VVKYLDGLTLQHGFGEEPHGHIRSSPGAVNREKPQAYGGQAKEVGVAMGHQFIGFFRGCIKADGGICPLALGKGQFREPPVYAGAGGVDQTLHLETFGHLQDIEKSFQVGLLIGERVDQGITYSGLGRKMTDFCGAMPFKQGFQGRQVDQFPLNGDEILKLA